MKDNDHDAGQIKRMSNFIISVLMAGPYHSIVVMKMYVNFISVLGEEYIKIVANLVKFGPDLLDGHRIFSKVYGIHDITPEKLKAASDTELERLRDIACRLNGSDQINTGHIREVIRQTLARWSASPPRP